MFNEKGALMIETKPGDCLVCLVFTLTKENTEIFSFRNQRVPASHFQGICHNKERNKTSFKYQNKTWLVQMDIGYIIPKLST